MDNFIFNLTFIIHNNLAVSRFSTNTGGNWERVPLIGNHINHKAGIKSEQNTHDSVNSEAYGESNLQKTYNICYTGEHSMHRKEEFVTEKKETVLATDFFFLLQTKCLACNDSPNT